MLQTLLKEYFRLVTFTAIEGRRKIVFRIKERSIIFEIKDTAIVDNVIALHIHVYGWGSKTKVKAKERKKELKNIS